MKKSILTLVVIFLFVVSSFSQEKVLELPDSFSISFESNKESYSISNLENGNLMILLKENNKFYSYLLNSEYQQKSKINTKALPSKYNHFLGYTISNKTYSIFFSNSRKTKFGIQTFDFDTNTSKNIVLDFKIKGEKYVESINYKNKFHLITATKNSSDLNIYVFDKEGMPKKNITSLKQVDLQKLKKQSQDITFYSLLTLYTKEIPNSITNIEKIESKNPNALETTSKSTKLYQIDNELIFSFDHDEKETKLCFVDLETFTLSYKFFDKPSKTEKGYTRNNSYLYDNKIFQIASSSQKMKFTVSDLISKKIIKEYSIKKGSPIAFKNSPIIQESTGAKPFSFSNKTHVREMEKTAKFLRKISNSKIGISAYKIGSEYNIILGGVKEIYSGGAAGGFVLDVPNNGSGATFVSYNPTFYGYSGYSSTKSTYINCLFDNNFDHQQGEIIKNVFDKVNEFEDTLKRPMAKNIFLHQDNIHFCFLDKKDRIYKMYRFEY